jgi:Major Facilitator Superfamily
MPAEAVTAVAVPVERVHLRVAWLCGAVLFLEGYDIAAVGYALPSLVDTWKVHPQVFTPVLTAGNVGLLLGSLCAGLLGDRMGRKPVLIGCAVVFGIFSLLSAFAGSALHLAELRFLTGLGLGGGIPLAVALAADFAPPMVRGRLVIMMCLGVGMGFAVGGLLASQLVRVFGWPAIFVTGGVLPLALVPALAVWLPESPALRAATRQRHLVAGFVSGRARVHYGPALDHQSPQPAHRLLHPSMDASYLARHRRESLPGDFGHDHVRSWHPRRSTAHRAHCRPLRDRVCPDLRLGFRSSLCAFDRPVQSPVLVALGHHFRCWDWCRLPGRNQLAIGLGLSPSHPLDWCGLGIGCGACRYHRRAASGWRAAGTRISCAEYFRRRCDPRLRRDAVDGDPRSIAPQSVMPAEHTSQGEAA